MQFDKRVSEDGAAAHVCVDGLLALAAEALDCLRGLRVRPRGLQGCRDGSGTGLKFRYAGLETGNLASFSAAERWASVEFFWTFLLAS